MIKNVFRKSLVVGIIILFLGASIIPSMGNPIVVRQDLQDNKTTFKDTRSGGYIQDLIDNASDGDTIYVPSGIYYENIIIDKSISLVGEDKDTTIIDGCNIENVVYISADWVNISGFTIQNGTGGITFGSDNNNISNNVVLNNQGSGIANDMNFYPYPINNIIINNIISGNIWGISIGGSSYNNISGNIINHNINCGISIGCSSYSNIIDNNTISNCNCGLFLMYMTLCDPAGNIIVNNSFFNSGVVTGECACYYNLFFNNTVNDKPLIFLVDASDIVIDDAGQILLFGCKNVTIQNTELCNSTIGIIIYSSNNCSILNNNIRLNCGGGLQIIGSDNNAITGNNITNNEYGIDLYRGFGNNITGNTIILNKDNGIYLWYSSNNNITSNSISKNIRGIYFISSTNNTVLKNNFLRNIPNAFFKNCTNIWNQNYWNRPRILPKLIFGTIEKNSKEFLWFNIDWRPALRPYDI
jgi:parallel beta-helix repeat protein